MIGRVDERATIERLLAMARSGRSGALVFSGEPGVGKSVLLSHAVEQAAGMRVLQATGVETEVDLAFAGLDQLVHPVLDLVDRLPGRQADALLGALGLVDHVSQDRFLIAAATLSLLSETAEDRPVLCVVDDAQWLDYPSGEALAFAARRLEAEGVVVLVATRDDPWAGLPELKVGGFGLNELGELVHDQTGEDVAGDVRIRLLEETGGNPLALVELCGSLSSRQLGGLEPLPRPLPLTARIQEAFLTQVRRLPDASQTLLLLAAADDTADAAVVLRAADALDVSADGWDAVERAGLTTVDGNRRVVFRHPLVRAAVYQGARFSSRMAAHRALAGALDGDDQAVRRAWHLAATAIGPDDELAHSLEQSALAARRRGGYAVAAAAFDRAAELAATRPERVRLLVAAGMSAFQAGQAERAAALAERAEMLIDDPVVADDVAVLRGRIEFARGSSVAAHTLLVEAARGMAPRDPRGAAAVLLEAARAAWNAYDQDRYADVTALLATLRLPEGDPLGPSVSMALGAGALVAERIAEGVAGIRRGTSAWLPLTSPGQRGSGDASLVGASLAMAGFTRVTGDDSAGLALGSSAVAACRASGLVTWLPWALVNLSMTEALAGSHSAALVNGTEGLQLARDLGLPTAICGGESILAWLAAVRGDEGDCRRLAAHAVELSEVHQLAGIVAIATWALGLLELSIGRPERALDRLLDRTTGPLVVPSIRCLITPDAVEAAVRAGRPEDLGEIMAWYDEWATSTGQPWAAAAVHRCRALVAAGTGAAETHFREALFLHEQAGPEQRPFDRSRTQLLYGEWLRRAKRRADARVQLAPAHETFQRLGATPWVDRAITELRAIGQTVRRQDRSAAALTPQEAQVVRLVAEGGSNQEVAAQLFLSPRTVAYHLYKAFPKLGVTSRTDLARLDLDSLVTAP